MGSCTLLANDEPSERQVAERVEKTSLLYFFFDAGVGVGDLESPGVGAGLGGPSSRRSSPENKPKKKIISCVLQSELLCDLLHIL